jgi:YXWGXW repeat-containing protein
MHIQRSLSVSAGLLGLGIMLAGCANQPERTACMSVPPLPAEVVPKPPVSEAPLVWQPGHWEFVGNNYAWQQGAWVLRHGSTTWLPGYWSLAPGGTPSGTCVWNPGHFV